MKSPKCPGSGATGRVGVGPVLEVPAVSGGALAVVVLWQAHQAELAPAPGGAA
ncbi:hypothetical protein [Streptomyces sp. NPDC046832]|uniref:hypothetical protein n=1 Tax=Streptomyces sp. NPDC046832 TaxID=3155020 RepID=UPI0033E0FC9C